MAPLLKSAKLLKEMRGKKITRVRRQVFLEDYAFYSPELRDQESDGPTDFYLSDGSLIHAGVNSEEMAVELCTGPSPRLGDSFSDRDVSSNAFWSPRIGRVISGFDALQSGYAPEGCLSAFALEVFFEGAESAVIEYISDDDHVDQLRITGPYHGPPCRRIPLAWASDVRHQPFIA